MFGHPVTGRIERPAVFGCPARGTTVQSMSRMDIFTADTAGKLKVIAEAAVIDGSLFFKLQHIVATNAMSGLNSAQCIDAIRTQRRRLNLFCNPVPETAAIYKAARGG